MKKLALAIIAVFLITNVSFAAVEIGDVIKLLPMSNTGIFYNINDKEFEFTSTFKAVGWKGINLNLGYASPQTLVASIGYEILRLENFGIDIPILKDIVVDAGWTLGWDRLPSSEFVNGPSVTLKIKF